MKITLTSSACSENAAVLLVFNARGVLLIQSAAKEHRTDVVAAMESLAVLRATLFPGQALPVSWTRVATDSSFLCVTSETSDSTKHFCFKDLGLGFAVIVLGQAGWDRWSCQRGPFAS